MQASHGLRPVFDDPNLVSHAGLPAALRLADRAGLGGLLEQCMSLPVPGVAVKARTVLAGMLAGADDIDGMNILRAGGMSELLGAVRAPSTIGTFLRSFTHGHALQLAAVHARLLQSLAEIAPGMLAPGGLVLVDLDDTMREAHGYQKQAVAYGYNKTKGLNAILATISTPTSPPVIATAGLRRGNIRSGANAGWHATRALTQAAVLAPGRQALLRADSAFCTHESVAAARKAGAWFSITIPAWKNVTAAISQIPETAWKAIRYPRAVWDDQARAWISDAEVAEVAFTAFTSRRKSEHVPCRLIVRRVKRLGQSPGQDELFDVFRYHAFITDSSLPLVEADQRHRHHAVIEQVIAELKAGPLAHLPSGKFTANQAWLAFAVMAFNLSRALAHAAGIGTARMSTIKDTLLAVPGRIAHRARQRILHLPARWPWQDPWRRLWHTAHGPPAPCSS